MAVRHNASLNHLFHMEQLEQHSYQVLEGGNLNETCRDSGKLHVLDGYTFLCCCTWNMATVDFSTFPVKHPAYRRKAQRYALIRNTPELFRP